MKHRVLLPLLFLLACDTASDFTLPEESYFVKYYGKDGNQYGIDFIVNTDGSIVMMGNTLSSKVGDFQQIYLMKVDPNGAILWERSIGLTDKHEYARDLEVHPDGRLIIVGETEMTPGNRDVYIKTISQQGLPLDSSRVALTNSSGLETNEEVSSVSIVSNGFMVAGATTKLESAVPGANDLRDAMHLRFDNSLNWISELTGNWSDVTGSLNGDDFATKVIEVVPNAVYYVFGYSNNDFVGDNVNDYQVWVFQLDMVGVPSSIDLTFGDVQKDETLSAVSTTGVGFVLAGKSVQGTSEQSYLIKLTSANDLTAVTTLVEQEVNQLGARPGITVLSADEGNQIRTAEQSNGNFLMVADDYTTASPRIALTFLSREFSDNNQPPLIFDGGGKDFAGNVAELPNGRILLYGTMTLGGLGSQQKLVLMKLNPDGKLVE